MTVRVICEDMQNTVLGMQCTQCLACFPFVSGAVAHQERIWDNRGKCPDAPEDEEGDEP